MSLYSYRTNNNYILATSSHNITTQHTYNGKYIEFLGFNRHTNLQSLRIIPQDEHPSDAKGTNFAPAAPSVPGLVDTMRSGEPPLSISSKVNNQHPLEKRVANWDTTQREMQLETYRRMFGSAAPIKREMEMNIVKETDFKPEVLRDGVIPSPSEDILLNREATVGWEDIYKGFDKPAVDFHTEMERKMGI